MWIGVDALKHYKAFLILYFYIMIYKFQELKEPFLKVIEFQQLDDKILISSTEDELCPTENYVSIELDEEQLFELIGGLLRIQSKIKNLKK
jgi:hypothetical protein